MLCAVVCDLETSWMRRPWPGLGRRTTKKADSQWSTIVQTLLQWNYNEYCINCVCICSLRYPACNAHAPYYHLNLAQVYIIPHGRFFKKKKCYCTQNVFFEFLFNFCLKYFSLWKEMNEIWSTTYIGLYVKLKVTLVQALKLCTGRTAHRGNRGIALLFHDHGTRRGWGVSVTPRPPFTPGKDPVPIVQEAEWTPGPVWTGAENLAPTGIRSPDRPARSQSLYRLSYPAHKGFT